MLIRHLGIHFDTWMTDIMTFFLESDIIIFVANSIVYTYSDKKAFERKNKIFVFVWQWRWQVVRKERSSCQSLTSHFFRSVTDSSYSLERICINLYCMTQQNERKAKYEVFVLRIMCISGRTKKWLVDDSYFFHS
jgi:hypothetical protein